MHWLQFVMDLDSLDPAVVEDALLQAGATSVTLSDAGDDPVLEPGPGETPLWTRTAITGLFSGDIEPQGIAETLCRVLALQTLPPHRVERLEDREWEREWLRDFGPMRFGERLWICPHGLEVEADDAVVVRLDPGLAFGTGTHPTTALCLEWLDGIDLAGRSVLDYGCGSGVLAIAALKLGAVAAVGMDIDPQATIATRQNAADNAVFVSVCGSDAAIEGQFDVVVANILAGPLVELADSITSRLASRGMLALSGVLCEQADAVIAAYDPWIAFDEPVFREQDGQTWSRLTGSRR
jgi:ribosomal protein L11 methyltransferase